MPFIILTAAILFIPDNAFAWGPATHLEIGMDVLNSLNLVMPVVRGIIERFPYDYLYGNISADIVVAKNLAEEIQHCHNWRVGFNLLGRAESDSQKAFAYGYLSHLASDTVAHNLFVPEKLMMCFTNRMFRHVYWELRFDAMVNKLIWQLPMRIEKGVHIENDRLFNAVVPGTLLPFRANKTIFSSILILSRMERWQRMIDMLSKHSRWELERCEREVYYRLSIDAVIELLSKGHLAPCLEKDPRGKASIEAAKYLRRRLKRFSFL